MSQRSVSQMKASKGMLNSVILATAIRCSGSENYFHGTMAICFEIARLQRLL